MRREGGSCEERDAPRRDRPCRSRRARRPSAHEAERCTSSGRSRASSPSRARCPCRESHGVIDGRARCPAAISTASAPTPRRRDPRKLWSDAARDTQRCETSRPSHDDARSTSRSASAERAGDIAPRQISKKPASRRQRTAGERAEDDRGKDAHKRGDRDLDARREADALALGADRDERQDGERPRLVEPIARQRRGRSTSPAAPATSRPTHASRARLRGLHELSEDLRKSESVKLLKSPPKGV